jgi:hypothetical protein
MADLLNLQFSDFFTLASCEILRYKSQVIGVSCPFTRCQVAALGPGVVSSFLTYPEGIPQKSAPGAKSVSLAPSPYRRGVRR